MLIKDKVLDDLSYADDIEMCILFEVKESLYALIISNSLINDSQRVYFYKAIPTETEEYNFIHIDDNEIKAVGNYVDKVINKYQK